MTVLTFEDLRAHYRCPLGARYTQQRGRQKTTAQERGIVWHVFVEGVLQKVWRDGLAEYAVNDGQNLIDELLADPSFVLDVSDREWLEAAARYWCETRSFDPSRFIAVSQRTQALCSNVELVGKLDLVERYGSGVLVTDATTAHTVDEQASDLRTQFNVLLAFCAYPEAQGVAYRYDHPRIAAGEPHEYDLDDYGRLYGRIKQLVDSQQRSQLANHVAVRAGSWCHNCPGLFDCPTGKREVGALVDQQSARAALDYIVQTEARLSDARARLKSYCEATGFEVQSAEHHYGPEPREEAWSIRDRKALFDMLARHGEDPNDYVRKRQQAGFNYRQRKVRSS